MSGARPGGRTPLVVATTNRDKLREIRALLTDVPVDLAGLADFPAVDEPDETGGTFEANARIKATAYAHALAPHLTPGTLVAAEDSGLVIDALDGDPGVRSARYLRPDASYAERFADIARRLAANPTAARTARFVCALAVVAEGRIVYETRGVVEGDIAQEPRGAAGFGYDPIFLCREYGRTLGEVTDDEKRRVAHRGHAFRSLGTWLTDRARTT